jgi:hypothetical protein
MIYSLLERFSFITFFAVVWGSPSKIRAPLLPEIDNSTTNADEAPAPKAPGSSNALFSAPFAEVSDDTIKTHASSSIGSVQ